MKRYGFVASGGGYRSFYTAGVLVWLKKNNIPIVHCTSTSSGNNMVLDYLLWDPENETLPPTLTKTLRLSVKDIFDVFSNFLGLQPALIPNGSHMFTVNKKRCKNSLQLNKPARLETLAENLKAIQWDIGTTNLTKREGQLFRVNDILVEIDDQTLDRFMDVFIAGITTIPYFKAIKIEGDYYLEGGYTDNTPLRPLFENPDVDEIVAIDFTNYDYHAELDKLYRKNLMVFALNSIDMNLLVNNIQYGLPNRTILSQAIFINQLLEALDKPSLDIDGKTYYHKPLHILTPENLESMTISSRDMRAQKDYFAQGQTEIEALLETVQTGK
jgi:predicted acylesterase/phospholipase RssA